MAAKKKKKMVKAPAEEGGPGGNATPSKTQFVRSLPPGTSYDEAAEKATAVGLRLSKGYFHVLKSQLKKKAGGGIARGKPGTKPRATAAPSGLKLSSGDPNEQALLDALRVLGAARARGLIEAFERFEGAR